jgi:hypothetical protein
VTRREVLGTLAAVTAATSAAAAVPSIDAVLIELLDRTVERYLAQQNTHPLQWSGCRIEGAAVTRPARQEDGRLG